MTDNHNWCSLRSPKHLHDTMTQSLRLHISMATPLLLPGARVTHSGELIRAVVTLATLPLGVFEDDTVFGCVLHVRVIVYVGELACTSSEEVCEENHKESNPVGQWCGFGSSSKTSWEMTRGRFTSKLSSTTILFLMNITPNEAQQATKRKNSEEIPAGLIGLDHIQDSQRAAVTAQSSWWQIFIENKLDEWEFVPKQACYSMRFTNIWFIFLIFGQPVSQTLGFNPNRLIR